MTKKLRRKPVTVKTGHTLVKADIVDNVREATGLTVDEAKKGVEGLITLLKRGLVEDRSVLISSFGKFEARLKKPRPGRNPKTGEKMILSERMVATFKLSRKLRAQLNEEWQEDGVEEGY
ncbi:MAG TPA: HU family DNA-binding protein [Candidatus Desulfovibrio intestinipullorum]|uniref:HU family DNA-binding protein n=1 Tax=Candidatus Desulfovibrio intestinipullorum TaxID=2838536 RepID=A0A9D1TPQ8_9BACT|nr:HU family DNA-binding protein [Candidatus Desulfovibrio intestinipullorum]